MQTLTLNSIMKENQLPASQNSTPRRALRFLSERYAQRERPSVVAEYILFAVIVLTSTWPMFTLAHALGLRR
jgi:hypothetical protein